MKAFNGYKAEASGNKFKPLPAGPYVAKIKNVKIEGQEPDQALILRMDVIEGPHAGYFMDRYQYEMEHNKKFEPKYKGDFRIRIPNDDNKDALYPESDRKKFKDAMYRIEHSNPDFRWDWDENALVGLIVGINMQESEYNGNPFTKIGRLEIADDVRKGIVQPMQPARPRGNTDAQTGFTRVDEPAPWF